MRRICVFCGSNPGRDKKYLAAAAALGGLLAEKKIGLVYGGASVGLMGAVADAALARGGEVIGVIPEDIVRMEVAHKGLADLRVVGSMHERKALMEKLSDGFIAMPGGFGTLDEFCEILTWAQLGLHQKPCGILNVGGYFDPFLDHLDHSVAEGFIKPRHRAFVLESDKPAALLERFAKHHAVKTTKWLKTP